MAHLKRRLPVSEAAARTWESVGVPQIIAVWENMVAHNAPWVPKYSRKNLSARYSDRRLGLFFPVE